jgi:hypothetical protein
MYVGINSCKIKLPLLSLMQDWPSYTIHNDATQLSVVSKLPIKKSEFF